MNARTNLIIPALGEQVEGGFFHGVYLLGAELWGEVTAPKAVGEISGLAWHPSRADVPSALSDLDGLANTRAMAETGSPLAKAALECRHAGFDDWHIAGRGGLLLQRANLQQLLPEEEKFEAKWYWSSTQTQFGRDVAYSQFFGNGDTGWDSKSWAGGSARLVRRFRIQ